ncbi:hypothetical protein CVO96_07575 [Deinococcus koreensis]|uniref:Outer membrane protein beta-barrel domain-containing protein n=2 Tax=Deinococcus koreensis TaxID=2054903 RepID=A0A2K3UXL0_9DEIO|nr:hypothetical protein CVO96_07575 [Deinococcus koreensis]
MLGAMRKMLILLALATAATTSTAAADKFGAHIGTSNGLQYVQDLSSSNALRYSLNLDLINLFSGGSLAVGGDVAYLNDFGGTTSGFAPYYGAGLGAYVSVGKSTGVSVYPHGIVGLNFDLTDPFSVFVEGSLGARIGVGSASSFGLGYGARLGVNYRFR